MTPDNDKTLRGIFIDDPLNDWNDRAAYKNTYERSFVLDPKSHVNGLLTEFIIPSIEHHMRSKTIVDDDDRGFEEENYIMGLEKIFPEAEIVRQFYYYNSFGMGYDMDGEATCDMCGTKLHPLNSSPKTEFGLCDTCAKYANEEVTAETLGLRLIK